ncbi:hypothetical protein [Pedobacter frigidisoli]|uniref:hypothetical protein n=1 Tax=Pedobacter frigidisoli TaxID=2530455 RepID=UPI00292DB3F5|nr:hypothetical protein [Pedobacter frigidisoli]
MDEFIIKVGSLNSLNSLYTFLGSAMTDVRNRFIHGNFTEIKFDLRNLIYQKINISALTAFISTGKKIREATGKPIGLILTWDPNILAFLTDIDFFAISEKLDIFYWDKRMVGGFRSGNTNPDTKIIYFSDGKSMSISNILANDDLLHYKSGLKQKIAPNFALRCSSILNGFPQGLINTITNSTIELIVNALVHGQDIAVVGLQRSSRLITVSVSDGGIGVRKSIMKTFGEEVNGIDNAQGLVISALMQKKEHGLRLAIEEVLNYEDNLSFVDMNFNEGWVNMSSFDAEIRWQKSNWSRAKSKFDYLDDLSQLPEAKDFLSDASQKVDKTELDKGYWRKHNNILVGTRITFEIPL